MAVRVVKQKSPIKIVLNDRIVTRYPMQAGHPKKLEARPGRSSRREVARVNVPKNTLRELVSWTERALRKSQRATEELLALVLCAE